MSRPVHKVKLQAGDRIIEWIGIVACVVLIVLPIYFYSDLPEEVPRHFGADGTPDAWGSRNYVFMMPAIGFALFVGLNYLAKMPHIHNYTVTITEENAAFYYRRSSRMIRVLNTAIVLAFLYLEWMALRTALGTAKGLGGWFLPVFLVAMFGIPIGFLLGGYKKKA